MNHVITLRDFICKFCGDQGKSTAAKPVACSKRECQRKRQNGRHTKSHKPKASTAKAPEPMGSNKRHGAVWGELDALIAMDGRD